MGIGSTVTLEEDVALRLEDVSRTRGVTVNETLNALLREALGRAEQPVQKRTLEIKPTNMGLRPGLSYDSVESLLEFAEGEDHR